ncbi:protease [Archangium lansingense]|uniref:protease n=1 Tax=Archangium lansingense TaxID=2995310 RepID=UPI003B76F691
MTRGYSRWVALFCLTLGACASRKEASEPKPAPAQQQPAPAPQAAPEPTKENPAMAATLDCVLSVPPSVRAGEPVELRFQLTNRTAQPLYVLTWRTPLEGVRGKDFRITREGTEVLFQGPMVKRGNPQADQYVTLAPGASVDAKIDLSQAYEMKHPGRYRIEFRGDLMDVAEKQADVPRSLDQLQSRPVSCPAVETTITAP